MRYANGIVSVRLKNSMTRADWIGDGLKTIAGVII